MIYIIIIVIILILLIMVVLYCNTIIIIHESFISPPYNTLETCPNITGLLKYQAVSEDNILQNACYYLEKDAEPCGTIPNMTPMTPTWAETVDIFHFPYKKCIYTPAPQPPPPPQVEPQPQVEPPPQPQVEPQRGVTPDFTVTIYEACPYGGAILVLPIGYHDLSTYTADCEYANDTTPRGPAPWSKVVSSIVIGKGIVVTMLRIVNGQTIAKDVLNGPINIKCLHVFSEGQLDPSMKDWDGSVTWNDELTHLDIELATQTSPSPAYGAT